MARNKFYVEVLTPEGQVFSGEVEMLSTRTQTGSIGLLSNHAPLLAILEPTELRLYQSESEILRLAQGEGYLQMDANRALVLVEEAIEPAQLDSDELKKRLDEAQHAAEQADADTEEHARSQRDAKRYKAFLEVAGTSR
jgi:F-type H+-transporting ATPase subunit epsilon